MEKRTQETLDRLNCAIIKYRGSYSKWSAGHGISYNEMLVLYTIRDRGFCTQKQICDSYILPRQTINNTISQMRKNGLLAEDAEKSLGREKAFVLTDEGKRYSEAFLKSLNAVEECTVERMGIDKIERITELMLEFDRIMEEALAENRNPLQNAADVISRDDDSAKILSDDHEDDK